MFSFDFHVNDLSQVLNSTKIGKYDKYGSPIELENHVVAEQKYPQWRELYNSFFLPFPPPLICQLPTKSGYNIFPSGSRCKKAYLTFQPFIERNINA